MIVQRTIERKKYDANMLHPYSYLCGEKRKEKPREILIDKIG